jgi:hypothetical protein
MFIPTALLAQRGPYGRQGPFDSDTAGGPGPSRAYSVGMVGYTGGDWQPTGLEFAWLWRLSEHGQTAVGPWIALGSFTQSQAIYFGRSKGFFSAIGLTVRQPIVTLLEMGSERTPSFVRVETSLHAGWSKDFNSPLPQGPSDFRAALLLGISLGSRMALGQSFSLMYGPSILMGHVNTTHGQFMLRVRLPVH